MNNVCILLPTVAAESDDVHLSICSAGKGPAKKRTNIMHSNSWRFIYLIFVFILFSVALISRNFHASPFIVRPSPGQRGGMRSPEAGRAAALDVRRATGARGEAAAANEMQMSTRARASARMQMLNAAKFFFLSATNIK